MAGSTWLPREQWLKTLESRPASANILLENSRHELLIINQTYRNIWSVPGGVIDTGETPLEAAIREVKEEVGIIVKPEELHFTTASLRHRNAEQFTYQFTFLTKIDDERLANLTLQSSEIKSHRFVSKNDIKNTPTKTSFTANILHWANDHPNGYMDVAITKDNTGAEHETITRLIPFL